ncbi:MAG: DUF86 domain-containing protein [archaeon]
MKDYKIFIEHILDSINKIETFSKGLTKEKFDKDELRQSAIIRQLEIIGEATKNLSVDFTNKYPYIEWSSFARTRDKIIHHYFGIDLDIVWEIIKKDLPKLKENIKKILEDMDKNKESSEEN